MDKHKLAEELHKQALRMVEEESVLEQEWESFDFQKAFKQILEQNDWTDRVVRGIERVRGAIHRPRKDTRLPEDLRALIPDMKQVAAAYAEMTEGYKEFIRTVLQAKNQTRKV